MQDGALAGRPGRLQLAFDPGELVLAEPEVGAACAGGHHVQEQAAVPLHGDGVRQGLGAQDVVVGVEAARLEVVVAGQDVQRQPQGRHGVAHEAELLRRAVVGVVAGQDREIQAARRQRVGEGDDAAEVAMVLLSRHGQMKVADMQPAQHAAPGRIVGSRHQFFSLGMIEIVPSRSMIA